jgi:hypothetical protein
LRAAVVLWTRLGVAHRDQPEIVEALERFETLEPVESAAAGRSR